MDAVRKDLKVASESHHPAAKADATALFNYLQWLRVLTARVAKQELAGGGK
jgi:hypothetical protein